MDMIGLNYYQDDKHITLRHIQRENGEGLMKCGYDWFESR